MRCLHSSNDYVLEAVCIASSRIAEDISISRISVQLTLRINYSVYTSEAVGSMSTEMWTLTDIRSESDKSYIDIRDSSNI
jgi:hypothetical protein